MTVEEKNSCWQKEYPNIDRNEMYSKLSNTILEAVKDNNLNPSENTYDLLDEILSNIMEGWYRYSLGK